MWVKKAEHPFLLSYCDRRTNANGTHSKEEFSPHQRGPLYYISRYAADYTYVPFPVRRARVCVHPSMCTHQ